MALLYCFFYSWGKLLAFSLFFILRLNSLLLKKIFLRDHTLCYQRCKIKPVLNTVHLQDILYVATHGEHVGVMAHWVRWKEV